MAESTPEKGIDSVKAGADQASTRLSPSLEDMQNFQASAAKGNNHTPDTAKDHLPGTEFEGLDASPQKMSNDSSHDSLDGNSQDQAKTEENSKDSSPKENQDNSNPSNQTETHEKEFDNKEIKNEAQKPSEQTDSKAENKPDEKPDNSIKGPQPVESPKGEEPFAGVSQAPNPNNAVLR